MMFSIPTTNIAKIRPFDFVGKKFNMCYMQREAIFW